MNVNDNIQDGQYMFCGSTYYQFMYHKEKEKAIHQLQNARFE